MRFEVCMKFAVRNRFFGLTVLITLVIAISCSSEDEPCSSFDPFCSREARAKLSVNYKNMTSGEQFIFDASDSTYDQISWFVNGTVISECNGQEVCAQTWTKAGKYNVSIKVKVEAKGEFTSFVTQGFSSNEITKAKTSMTVTVSDSNSSSDTDDTDDTDTDTDTDTGTGTGTTTLTGKRIFVSNTTQKGADVDTINCSSDASNPNGGTYSALIFTGIIQANTKYISSDALTAVGTSDGSGNLSITTAIGAGTVWTGLTAAQTADNNCTNWSSSLGGVDGTTGDASQTGSSAYSINTTTGCNQSHPVYCVEQ